MEQLHHHLPQLALTRSQLLFVSIAATATAVGVSFSMSNVIGYPLPFTAVVGTPPWFVVISILVVVLKRQQLRDEPGLGTRVLVFRYLLVLLCQVAMTMIYPSYNFVYSRLSSMRQTAFILLLPVIKIVTKNWISRSLPDSDDAKPEAVIFNVEIFHALFVALCMGSTTSSRTIVALMLVDFVQAWLSFQDILAIFSALKPIVEKLDATRARTDSFASKSRKALQSLVPIANTIIEAEQIQASNSKVVRDRNRSAWSLRSSVHSILWPTSWRFMSQYTSRRVVPGIPTATFVSQVAPSRSAHEKVLTKPLTNGTNNQVSPTPRIPGPVEPVPTDLASLTTVERGVLVLQTQRLLYVTEFIVLIEYTEVIMPLIYNTIVYAMYHRPNREYYTFLFGVCTMASLRATMANVTAYASLEFVSLLVMALIVWWKLRFSLIHQLAFVLEHRTVNIQAKILVWVLDTMQTSIVHLGPDYSFRFEWLRRGDTNIASHKLSSTCATSTHQL